MEEGEGEKEEATAIGQSQKHLISGLCRKSLPTPGLDREVHEGRCLAYR